MTNLYKRRHDTVQIASYISNKSKNFSCYLHIKTRVTTTHESEDCLCKLNLLLSM
jgi:hypothetical protein